MKALKFSLLASTAALITITAHPANAQSQTLFCSLNYPTNHRTQTEALTSIVVDISYFASRQEF